MFIYHHMVILTQSSDLLVTLWLTRIRISVVKTSQKHSSNMIKHKFVPIFSFSLSVFIVPLVEGFKKEWQPLLDLVSKQ